jgi:WD40 repeat protein
MDRPFRLRDAVTGRQLLSVPGANELSFNSDDRWLGLRSINNKYQALRVAAGNELRVLYRQTSQGAERFDDMAAHPDGRLLAVTTRTGLGFFDLRTCEEIKFVAGNFHHVGFDRMGALWTSGAGGFLRWSVQSSADTADRLRIGPPEWVANMGAFSERGHFSEDGRVAVVPLYNQGALVVYRGASRRTLRLGPQHDARWVKMSPDGRWIVTGSHHLDGSGVKWKVWETDTGKLLANLPHPDVNDCPGFSPDSRWLYVTGTEDRRLDVGHLASPSVPVVASAKPRSPAWQGRVEEPESEIGRCI